ncbi:MAG TPA: efflux RND transporter periplasmic adaptor subunit [Burkholderiales bacterium]|nr:efflux RND transporter periplasmic adaptor subunit [Burkholderiales bacterium]
MTNKNTERQQPDAAQGAELTEATPARNGNGKRKKLLALVLGVFAAAGIAYGAYWSVFSRDSEGTDDAYVNGNVVQITPQIGGTVVAIEADDTDFVKAGKTLVRLDTADSKVALEEAESQLAKTVRQVRNLYATSAQLQASVRQREADLARAQEDVRRRERLASSGAVSGEELQHARDALRAAEAAAAAARQQLAAQQALVDRTTVEDHPDVRAAAARVHEAYLAYSRTALPAPVSGYVAKRSVQLGQHVTPGVPLMAIVPLDQVWVDANFKEGQLKNMRPGQPATLTADLYGGKIKYHGKVAGFGAGTGGAFALLPAQNASGNWIKIVQRVPVRIAIDPAELAAHPLQVGLSMQVTLDTTEKGGQRLPQVEQRAKSDARAVFNTNEQLADQRVKSIIAANNRGAVVQSNETSRAPRAPANAQTLTAAASAAHVAGAAGSHGRE